MKLFHKLSVAAGFALGMFGFSGLANAADFTFDFTNSSRVLAPSFSFTQGDVSLTATGSDAIFSRAVVRNTNGLGVTNSLDFASTGSADQVDGAGLFGALDNERLRLSFNQAVNLVSATFSRVGFNDDFRLLVDGNLLVTSSIPGGTILDTGIGSFNFVSFSPGNFGKEFLFTVKDFNDDFYLKSIVVSTVPEPATIAGVLVVTGLGVASARKRKQASRS